MWGPQQRSGAQESLAWPDVRHLWTHWLSQRVEVDDTAWEKVWTDRGTHLERKWKGS